MNEDLTLDPPGSIAVIGAGPIGIEAALYGRFLGYNVRLYESDSIASSYREKGDQPLDLPPDRSVSPLALSALIAQFPELELATRPTMIGDWIQGLLEPITQTDLLRGRFECPAQVTRIEMVAVDLDASTEAEGDDEDVGIPPDFLLSIEVSNSETTDGHDQWQCEAVIDCGGVSNPMVLDFDPPVPYFFRVSGVEHHACLQEIVSIFASLAGRPDLDLYRPRRS